MLQFRPLLLHLAVNVSEQTFLTFLPASVGSTTCHLMLLYKLTSFFCKELLPPSLAEHSLFASWTLFRDLHLASSGWPHLPPHPTFVALLFPCKLLSFCTPAECHVGASDSFTADALRQGRLTSHWTNTEGGNGPHSTPTASNIKQGENRFQTWASLVGQIGLGAVMAWSCFYGSNLNRS